MSRRYNTSESKNRREIVIKREFKTFVVVEGRNILFKSLDFEQCVDFLKSELNKVTSTGQKLYA